MISRGRNLILREKFVEGDWDIDMRSRYWLTAGLKSSANVNAKYSVTICYLSSSDHGIARVNATVPDTVTSWMIQAVSISPQHGVCVAQPVDITAKKLIYVSLRVPRAAIIGEQVEIRATVYNYLEQRRNVSSRRWRRVEKYVQLNPNPMGPKKIIRITRRKMHWFLSI